MEFDPAYHNPRKINTVASANYFNTTTSMRMPQMAHFLCIGPPAHSRNQSLLALLLAMGAQSRGALVTRQLYDVEKGSILIRRAQQCVISTNCINGRLREGHPTMAAPTEKTLMQTTVVKRHRTYLSGFLWLRLDCFAKN